MFIKLLAKYERENSDKFELGFSDFISYFSENKINLNALGSNGKTVLH